jgi:hypothetical protein
MKKIMFTAFTVLLAFLLSACDVTPGGRCDQEGSKTTNKNGYSYTCGKITGTDGKPRLVWKQDAPLTPDRP